MEIISSGKERNTVYIAVLTLAVVGVALVFSTWQTLRRQEDASFEHLALTSLAVLQAVDSSLRRGPMMGPNRLPPETLNFFRDLEDSGDILFVAALNADDIDTLLKGDGTKPPLTLPNGALGQLTSGLRWQGQAMYGDRPVYVAARAIQRARPHHRRDDAPPQRRREESPPPLLQNGRAGPPPVLYLLVAVDMDKHFAVYAEFKRTAVFQTAYILAAAAFLWGLAVRFISRRKLAGKAAHLERLQTRLVDSLPDGLLMADAEGVIRAANPAARAMFADKGPALAGRRMADLSLPFSGGADNGWTQVSLEGMQLEIRALPYQGEEDAPLTLVIIRDRTQLRTLEKNLAEAEQLAAIGGLAAGVAHEIRNPLSALRGFAQYFAKKLVGKKPEEEYAATMVREADRLNRVVTDLLYLAKPRDLAPTTLDLKATAEETTAILRFELHEHGLALDLDLSVTSVTADPDALKQALLNLLLNSIEAMSIAGPDETPPTTEKGASRIVLAAQRGTESGREGVWVRVVDSGPGMGEEERTQALKPFFSTKKKGTGLGLALVHTIMRGHDGALTIESPPRGHQTGCAVSLFFPDAPGSAGSI